MYSKSPVAKVGLDAALCVSAPLVGMVPFIDMALPPTIWQLIACAISFVSTIACAMTMYRHTTLSKIAAGIAAISLYTCAIPFIFHNQFVALLSTLLLLFTIYWVLDYSVSYYLEAPHPLVLVVTRATRAAMMLPVVAIVAFLFTQGNPSLFRLDIEVEGLHTYPFVTTLSVATTMAVGYFLVWVIKARPLLWLIGAIGAYAVVSTNIFVASTSTTPTILAMTSLLCGGLMILLLPNIHDLHPSVETPWYEPILTKPTQILVISFLSLCLIGTLLLLLPASTVKGEIGLLEAVFTAVSAVCVSGLSIMDTGTDFTLVGQAIILVLIQLGGLGIMSITTFGLYAFGKRLSLKHEVLVSNVTGADIGTLLNGLRLILTFTVVVETLGWIGLTISFIATGEPIMASVGKALFLAISAFCNAGFMIMSNSLVSYAQTPGVLLIVGLLIMCGGSAPIATLAIPKLIKHQPVDISTKLALLVTLVLTVFGTLMFLMFEWDNSFAQLPVLHKTTNALFASISLRTAGFNAVDLIHAYPQTYVWMMILMFMGGNAGGTSGGLKTATVGVLAATFWANITHQQHITIAKRQVHPSTITLAVTILVAGIVTWLVITTLLLATQTIPSDVLIFESTSAIATTGLSMGATTQLNDVGKFIIIVTMFIGRLGPTTIFMLLTGDATGAASFAQTPKEHISLT